VIAQLALALALANDSTFVLTAARATRAPRVDGVVDAAEWAAAPVASRFIQYAPRLGEPAARETRAWVLYDSTHLYVAFRVADDGEPTAQLTRRDSDLLSDDAVVLMLDTHHDRRSGYYFITNLLGTQADGRIADDGRTIDNSWDASWQSAARRTADGWEAEFAIPLTSVSFRAGAGRTWGINFGRSHRRTLEQSFWAGPLDNAYRMSQAGRLEGLTLVAPPKRTQVIAYGLTRAQDKQRGQGDIGADLRYAITPRMAFTGTVNPDFATIEADVEQVNLTRFELSLAEKRPFFLEGSELFRQRIRTFYTRRISDIRGGAKVFGKQGPWTVAAIHADGYSTSTLSEPAYTVLRAQRDVTGRSNVALMAANRDTAGQSQGSVGLDANLFFTRTLGMTAQAVHSYGPFSGHGHAMYVRPSYDSPTGHFHVRYTDLGSRFQDNANAVGFITDDNRREADAALSKTVHFQSGALQRVDYNSNYNTYWSQAWRPRAWEVRQSLGTELRNRISASVSRIDDLQRFGSAFRNNRTTMSLGYNTRAYQSARLNYTVGHNFGSDLSLIGAAAAYKVTEALSVEYELSRLSLSPDPDTASTWIHVGRLNHFFTKDLYLRVFYQTNSVIERQNLQTVFVWRYLPPFGTLQLAFQRGTAAFGAPSDQGNTLFLKATTVF
jgi:hypothetical protein